MRSLSRDDASGCKLLHIPGVLQSPLSETQWEAVVNTVISAHLHTLEMNIFLSLKSGERNKQIKCKSKKKKKSVGGEKEKNELALWNFFSKAGLFLSNNVLTLHGTTINGRREVDEINYTMVNLLLSKVPLRESLMFT